MVTAATSITTLLMTIDCRSAAVLGQPVWHRVISSSSMQRRQSRKETVQISTTVRQQLWILQKQIAKRNMVASSLPCTACWTTVLQGRRSPCKADQPFISPVITASWQNNAVVFTRQNCVGPEADCHRCCDE